MASLQEVRKIALALPGAAEQQSWGHAMWTVNGKGFVWERPLRKPDLAALGSRAPKGDILGVRTADLEMKDVFLASDPNVFFTIPHFEGYSAVLVRLNKISARKLHDVIVEAWLCRAPRRAVEAYLTR